MLVSLKYFLAIVRPIALSLTTSLFIVYFLKYSLAKSAKFSTASSVASMPPSELLPPENRLLIDEDNPEITPDEDELPFPEVSVDKFSYSSVLISSNVVSRNLSPNDISLPIAVTLAVTVS